MSTNPHIPNPINPHAGLGRIPVGRGNVHNKKTDLLNLLNTAEMIHKLNTPTIEKVKIGEEAARKAMDPEYVRENLRKQVKEGKVPKITNKTLEDAGYNTPYHNPNSVIRHAENADRETFNQKRRHRHDQTLNEIQRILDSPHFNPLNPYIQKKLGHLMTLAGLIHPSKDPVPPSYAPKDYFFLGAGGEDLVPTGDPISPFERVKRRDVVYGSDGKPVRSNASPGLETVFKDMMRDKDLGPLIEKWMKTYTITGGQ